MTNNDQKPQNSRVSNKFDPGFNFHFHSINSLDIFSLFKIEKKNTNETSGAVELFAKFSVPNLGFEIYILSLIDLFTMKIVKFILIE